MRERKLRSGVHWQGALKQKRHDISGRKTKAARIFLSTLSVARQCPHSTYVVRSFSGDSRSVCADDISASSRPSLTFRHRASSI